MRIETTTEIKARIATTIPRTINIASGIRTTTRKRNIKVTTTELIRTRAKIKSSLKRITRTAAR